MERKWKVAQTVISALGVIAAFVATLLTTPLDGSVDTLAARAIHSVPRFALGVAAGVATIFVARLLTLVGRKVRPLFRTRSTKLRALASEIEELRGFETPTGPDALPRTFDHLQQRDKLMAKLEKLGIPTPTKEQLVILHSFLTVLYDCAIRGDVERAKAVLREFEPEIDARRDAEAAAKFEALAPEIEELYRHDLDRLLKESRGDDLFISRHVPRVDRLRAELRKLGIPLPAKVTDRESFSRWQTFLHDLYGWAIRGAVERARGVLERLEAADQKPAVDGNEGESGAPDT